MLKLDFMYILKGDKVVYIFLVLIVIDIGANLTDSMYQGIYHGSQKHQPDLDKVLERSWNNNLSKIIITAGNVEESKKALEIARTDGKSSISLVTHVKLVKRLFYI